jgi:predicted PurR-regulated permease PerM
MHEAGAPKGFRPSLIVVLLVTASVLYVARAVFIPLSLAILLSFLLAPLIHGLGRRGLGRGPAVAVAMFVSAFVIVSLTALVAFQVLDLMARVPGYRVNIQSKSELVRRRVDVLEHLTRGVDVFERQTASGVGRSGPPQQAPLRVQLVESRLASLTAVAGPILAPIATAGLVLVFVIFMLMQWDDLRDRILRLSGQGRLSVTTRALEDASNRVSRYLQLQLLINACSGLVFGLGVWAIGVPNAPLSGFLFATLRFIPYVGAWVAAAFPLVVAFAANDGWMPLLLVIALFGTLEIAVGQILEPWLYRSKTGLSPIGILISFVFWGWMWGGVGLLLATPLTVCLVVAGNYIPQLEMLSILLGDQGALAPWARLYHRLLALDPDEAAVIVEDARKETSSTSELYDTLFAPALAMAERDRQSEQLSEERSRLVYASLQHFIDVDGPAEPQRTDAELSALCIPARSDADFISSVMAVRLLRDAGLPSDVTPPGVSLADLIEAVALRRPRLIVVAALPQLASVSVHERCRKLRDLFPEMPIVAAVWANDDVPANTAARWMAAGADTVVTTYAGMMTSVRELLEP